MFNTVPPRIVIDGPMIAHIGEMVNITCSILKGRPTPSIRIINPTNEIMENHNIIFSATVQHTGYFICTANISTLVVTEEHYMLVYGKCV